MSPGSTVIIVLEWSTVYSSESIVTAVKVCNTVYFSRFNSHNTSGPICSKLTMSLVNVLLKFQMLISEICQYFLLKNVRSFCNVMQKLLTFFQQKLPAYLAIK